MFSLRDLLTQHASLLVLDAASSRIQVGAVRRDQTTNWQGSDVEAGTGLFQCVSALGVDVNSVEAFVFCEGPGSILGIRTAAMAIRTWNILKLRPTYGYDSLALVAEAQARDVTVIADARRNLWHSYKKGGRLRRGPAEELSGSLVMPAPFRHWSPLPNGVTTVPYDLSQLLPQTDACPLFRSTDSPDAFLHEEPTYVTWTPQIHRAPT